MVTNALNKMWKAAADARRWMIIANALDILSESYEMHTAIPATAMLTSEGVYIEMEFEGGAVTEILEPDDILDLSPEAYDMLRRAGAIPATSASLN